MNAKITKDEIEVIQELVAEVLSRDGLDDHLRNLAGRTRNICYLKHFAIKADRRIQGAFTDGAGA